MGVVSGTKDCPGAYPGKSPQPQPQTQQQQQPQQPPQQQLPPTPHATPQHYPTPQQLIKQPPQQKLFKPQQQPAAKQPPLSQLLPTMHMTTPQQKKSFYDNAIKYRLLCRRDQGCVGRAQTGGGNGQAAKLPGNALGSEHVPVNQGVQFGLPTQGISVNNGAFTPKVPIVASRKPKSPKSFFKPQIPDTFQFNGRSQIEDRSHAHIRSEIEARSEIEHGKEPDGSLIVDKSEEENQKTMKA